MNVVVWTHDTSQSQQDVVVSPSLGFAVGDIVEIASPLLKEAFIFKARDPVDLLSTKSFQLSLSQALADLLGLSTRDAATLRKLTATERECMTASRIELICKDAYIGRAEMLRMHLSLIDTCSFVGERLPLIGTSFRARTIELAIGSTLRNSALVSADTEIVFRSQSASICIFVQVSAEVWSFDADGSLFHEKIGDFFLSQLFARIAYQDHEAALLDQDKLTIDAKGRKCMDLYKVLVDCQVNCDWKKVREILVREIVNWKSLVVFESSVENGGALGRITAAHDGNVLEAINLGCKSLDKRFLDRDLMRTGMNIILVTPGTCFFHVDQHLLRLTDQRLMDMGLVVDCVSLAKLPLHDVPVFSFMGSSNRSQSFRQSFTSNHAGQGQHTENASSRSRQESADRSRAYPQSIARLIDTSSAIKAELISDPLFWDPPSDNDGSLGKSLFYTVPPFLDSSFFSRQPDKPFRSDRFMPRARMPAVESLVAVAQCDNSSISLPLMPKTKPNRLDADREERVKERNTFDLAACSAKTSTQIHQRKTESSIKPRQMDDIVNDEISISPSMRSNTRGRDPARRPSSIFPSASRASDSVVSGATPQLSYSAILSSQPAVTPLATSDLRANSSSTFSPALLTRISAQAQWSSKSSRGGSQNWLSLLAGKGRTLQPVISSSSSPSADMIDSDAHLPQQNVRDASPVSLRSTQETLPIAIGCRHSSRSQSRPSQPGRPPKPSTSRSSSSSRLTDESYSDYKVDRYNPCLTLHCRDPPGTYRFQRWPRATDQRVIKWKALCTPAQLPLYTNFLPTTEELQQYYENGEYFIPVKPQMTSFFLTPCEKTSDQAANLLKEMIYHRLLQGFQLVNYHKGLDASIVDAKGLRDMLERGRFEGPSGIVMRYARHIHRLSFDATKRRINVRIYLRRIPYERPDWKYRFVIQSLYDSRFAESESTFVYTDADSDIYDFPYLDRLISGLEQKQLLWKDKLLFWRTRYLVMPSPIRESHALVNSDGLDERSSDDDIRLTGIIKLFTYFQSSQWESPLNTSQGNISYLFVDTLHPSQYGTEEWQSQQSEQEARKKHTLRPTQPVLETPLDEIAVAMRDPLLKMKLETKRWHLQTFPLSFTGTEFVDWLVATFVDTDDRSAAVRAAKILQNKGLFRALGAERVFSDANYYFCLAPEFTPKRQTSRSWFRSRDDPYALTQPDAVLPSSDLHDLAAPSIADIKITMSTSLVSNLGLTRKSNRLELAQVHLDVVHNPKTAFHFEVNWIGATAVCIDEYIKVLNRTIERYGLSIVECPVRPPTMVTAMSPLKRFQQIELVHVPPSAEHRESIIYKLLLSLEYLMDTEAESRMPANVNLRYSYRRDLTMHSVFMHRSGMALVEVRDCGKTLIWSPNRSFISRLALKASYSIDESLRGLLEQLQSFCSDRIRLDAFFRQNEEHAVYSAPSTVAKTSILRLN